MEYLNLMEVWGNGLFIMILILLLSQVFIVELLMLLMILPQIPLRKIACVLDQPAMPAVLLFYRNLPKRICHNCQLLHILWGKIPYNPYKALLIIFRLPYRRLMNIYGLIQETMLALHPTILPCNFCLAAMPHRVRSIAKSVIIIPNPATIPSV